MDIKTFCLRKCKQTTGCTARQVGRQIWDRSLNNNRDRQTGLQTAGKIYKFGNREPPKVTGSLVEKVYRSVVRETGKIIDGQTGMQTYSQL
jgi:hypothetical protein